MQKASRPPQDRTMVVACLAEVAQNMGFPIAAYTDVILCLFFISLFPSVISMVNISSLRIGIGL